MKQAVRVTVAVAFAAYAGMIVFNCGKVAGIDEGMQIERETQALLMLAAKVKAPYPYSYHGLGKKKLKPSAGGSIRG